MLNQNEVLEKKHRDTKASVFFVQEKKCSKINSLKLKGFVIFDKIRHEKGGGGVAVAARTELNLVLLSEAKGDIDAITIDISTRNMIISCTSAYGPQTTATKETKNKF